MNWPHRVAPSHTLLQSVVFVVLLVVSAVPRMTGLGWGLPERYHCDERRVIQGAWRFATGQIAKPSDNVYSPLSSYLSRGAYLLSGGRISSTQPGTARFLRSVSALASSLTPPVLFLAATSLFGLQGGLVSALCLALTPGAIREAHFATVESILTFSLVMVFATGVFVILRPKSRLWILLPISVGIALSAKISALPAVLALVLLVPRLSPAGMTRRMIAAPFLVAAVFAVLAWNMIIDPRQYAFWAGKSGLDRTGVALSYYSLQFNRPQPFGGLISLLWMAGPILVAGGLLGTISFAHIVSHRRALLLAVVPPFFASFIECFTGVMPFVRMALPLVPLLALTAGSGIAFVWYRRKWLAASLAGLIVAGTGLAGVMYFTIYLEPDTRAQAERWLATHWSPGETVVLDGSDDLVTLSSIPKRAQRILRHEAQYALQEPVDIESLPFKDRLLFRLADWGATRAKDRALLEMVRAPPPVPTPRKRSAALNRQIMDVTWIVTTGTERARYLAHPDVFEPEVEFYDSLFSGALGFEVVATFSAFELPHPRILTPEPSWYFFDHPRVMILRRTVMSTVQ